MKIERLKELIEQNKTDDGINVEEINKAINDEINAVVTKAKDQSVVEFFKELGVESKDDLNAKLKEGDKLAKMLEEKEQAVKEAKMKADKLAKVNELRKLGVEDDDTIDYVLFNVEKRISDDKSYEEALKEFAKEKPKYFEKQATGVTTGVGTGTGVNPNDDKPTWQKILEEKHPDLKEK